MTPEQFLERLQKNGPVSAYLFLGPEPYQRERARRALIEAVLSDELVDLRQPDDLETRVGGAEQLAEHLGPAALHRDHDEVGRHAPDR